MREDASEAQQDVIEGGTSELTDCTTWAARPMAEWRERGYVPDSDDEDDVGLGAATLPKAPTAPDTPQESDLDIGERRKRPGDEPGHAGIISPTSSNHDTCSQEVGFAGEKIFGEEDKLIQAYPFGKTSARKIERDGPRSTESQAHRLDAAEGHGAPPAASVGDQLQAELEYGLQSVKEILGSAFTRPISASVDRSDTSSPLSSIRSFADDDGMVEDAGHNTPPPVQAMPGMEAGPQSCGYQTNSPFRYPGRDLRRRNPIQLHPYALEDARYQQELKARGMKPLRIAPGYSNMQHNLAADDTQDPDIFSSNPMDDSAEAEDFAALHDNQQSQNVLPPIVNRVAISSRSPAAFDDDEDLPELSVILGGDMPDVQVRKRRKVAYKSTKEAQEPPRNNDFHIPELPPADLDRTDYEDMDIDMFEIPPSPPRTGSSTASNTLLLPSKMSKSNDPTITPRALPTPVASSLTKALPEPQAEMEYSSDSSVGFQFGHQPTRDSFPAAGEMYYGTGIQSLQRRIKGVLPASWLTLDFDKRSEKKRPRRPSAPSPVKQAGAKGVAQRVRTDRPRASLAGDYDAPVIEISDDLSQETGRSPFSRPRAGWGSTLFEDDDGLNGPFLDDVVEDNRIDLLAPRSHRSGRRATLPAARQQKTLSESFRTGGVSHSAHTRMFQTKPKRKNQPTSNHNAGIRQKHRHHQTGPTPAQFGILDAPAFTQLPIDDQPQFLRIAARQVRMRMDKTQRTLPEYQLNPHTSDLPNPSIKTKPTAHHTSDQLASLKASTTATVHRVLLRQVGPASARTPNDNAHAHLSGSHSEHWTRGTSGNLIHHLDDPATATLPRRLQHHYQNRSGKGHLISTLAQARGPRSAQVETVHSSARPFLEQSFDQHLRVNTPSPQPRRKRVPKYLATLSQSLDQPLPQRAPGAEDCVAILSRGEMPSLVKGTFYHESTFIGGGDLALTIQKILRTPRNLDLSTGQRGTFKPPQTDELHIWRAWNPTVASQFSKVFESLFEECSIAITTQHNALAGIVPRLMFYMRAIIRYINDILFFEEATARASFVTTCVEVLLSIVIATQTDERPLPEDSEGDMIHILNLVVVFSFQVSHIASTPVIEHSLQLRAWNLFDTITRRILFLALGSRGLIRLVDYLERNKIHSVREKGIGVDFPEVDALVIISHLCRGKILGESCSTVVSKILTKKVDKHDADQTFDRLVEVMAFIWTITPYSSIDASGCLSPSMPTADDFSCWPVIVPVFEAFLKARIRSQDTAAPHNLIGRRYINFCLRLATGWGWVECAGLVQLLRIHYGSNNMDALFAEKGSEDRDFLEDYTENRSIQLNSDNDSEFDSFLKLTIVSGRQKTSRNEKTSRLSSFIFSLVPNSGQVLRKDQDHDPRVFRPLQNRHDLYTVLYFISPVETKSRVLQQIQSLVDFRESHLSACTINLKTLVRLIRFQISTNEDPSMLHNFAVLIQGIIKKMEEQFDEARMAASRQVDGQQLGWKFKSDVSRITRFNQSQIQNFLTYILRAWSGCIKDCRTVNQARYLVVGDNLAAVMDLCTRTKSNNAVEGDDDVVAFGSEVIEALLLGLTTYIITWVSKSENLRDCFEELQRPLKSVISTQLGRYDQCSDEILRQLTYSWHALAKISVDCDIRSWHNYLSQGGCDAWQSFDDTWHKRQYEILFAALFVESLGTQIPGKHTPNIEGSTPDEFVHGGASQDTWREWQVPMLQLWIASLLVPETRFKYQAHLTTAIMRFDAVWNPLMFQLPLVLYEDDVLVKVEIDELIAARTTLVLTLIRNMNKLTTRPDSQDAFFGPGEDDCSAILKSMMSLMKQYLAELEQEPTERAVYADFVSRVLFEMRLHTTHLEPVPNDFEYMPGRFLVAPGAIRAKLSLYKQALVDTEMEKHMVVYLHTTAERAAVSGRQETFEDQLIKVFVDLDPESLEDIQGHAADAHFRTLFLQNIFPAYLDRIFYGSGFIVARPVVACILKIYQCLRFRYGFWTKDYLEPFITATFSLVATLKNTLASSVTSPERILSDPNQLHAYALLCSLMFEVLCRCQEMEDSFGTFGALDDIWEYFFFFYQYTLMVAFRPPRSLPEALLHEDVEPLLIEPVLPAPDAVMLTYSRRELGDILDFKWVPGHGGTWFVNRSGGRREQVLGGDVVGSWEAEMTSMKFAAEKYVRGFAQLWNA